MTDDIDARNIIAFYSSRQAELAAALSAADSESVAEALLREIAETAEHVMRVAAVALARCHGASSDFALEQIALRLYRNSQPKVAA